MPIETNLNVSPYFDDYDPTKDYYRVLFKPGFAVQARELTQLQTILQHQIELFGDNIFKRGTIIDGCNFIFYDNYPYVKLLDSDTAGLPINVVGFNGYNVSDSSGVTALIVNYATGFEATDPDLNTIYLRYLNSGNNAQTATFTAGENLTIFDGNYTVEKVNIINGSTGFSNSDTVVFCAAITVQNTIGGITFANGTGGSNVFNVGDIINYVGTSNVRATIVEVNTTVNTAVLTLKIKPITADLTNSSPNPANWTFPATVTGKELTTNTQFVVVSTVGTSASATVITDGFGSIIDVVMTGKGSGYLVPPFVTLESLTGSYTNLNLAAQNYVDIVTVSTTTNAVGNGYAFGVTEGVIYQKGYFLRVSPLTVIVDKYSNAPDQLVVGFDTAENLANSNFDPTLLDNATGSPNFAAPGADRLQLTPELVVTTASNAAANGLFFSIVEWSAGQPFKQNRVTAYSTIEAEIAKNIENIDGDFVIQPFLITTKSANSMALEANSFDILVDPGTGYVGGYEVQTQTIFDTNQPKSLTQASKNPNPVPVYYGYYLLVDNFAGHFNFGPGSPVSLRDSSDNFYSAGNTTYANGVLTTNSTHIIPQGNEIGTARVRSIIYDNRAGSAIPGYSNAIYRMYLFDVAMNAGKSFANVAGVYSNSGTFQGIADVTVAQGGITSNNTALFETNTSTLVFPLGTNAIANVANIVYTYRTTKTVTANTTGGIVASAGTDENFLNSGALTTDTILIPQVNAVATVNAIGNVTSSSNTTLTGVGTTFTSDFLVGDWVLMRDNTNVDAHQIVYIANDTFLKLESNSAYTSGGSPTKLALILPHNVPVNLLRAGRSISVSGDFQTMTFALGNTFTASANMTLTYSAFTNKDTPVAKTVNRNIFVKLDLSNNAANTVGPWILGIPDVIRLKHVYRGYSTANTEITSNFYIDNGQRENFVDLATLVLRQGANLALSGSDKLLVQLDCFTCAQNHGPFAVGSWTLNDSANLASMPSSINTLEIPEMYSKKGTYYDLRDFIDFRPIVANTAAIATSNNTATINPVTSATATKFGNTADPSNDKRFPYPISTANTVIYYYLSRKDKVTINANGDFNVMLGRPDVIGKAQAPADARNSMTINVLDIPPYPSLPLALSTDMTTIADTGLASGNKFVGARRNNYSINIEVSDSNTTVAQPTGYTMKDIGALEERIKNLEQIVLLQELNQSIQTQESGTVYGFIADDFSTYDFADQSNPAYNASIINNECEPRIVGHNLPFVLVNQTGKNITLPWQPNPIVQQLNATDGCSGNVVTTQQFIQLFATGSPSDPLYNFITTIGANTYKVAVWDNFDFFASNTAGPVKLIFNGEGAPDKFYIFQSNTAIPQTVGANRSNASNVAHNNPLQYSGGSLVPLLVTTSDSMVNCTAAEIAALSPLGTSAFGFSTGPNNINFSLVPMGGYIGMNGAIWTGKVTWTHDPSKGRYYKIVVVKGNNSPHYRLWFYYPTDQPVTAACNNEFQHTPIVYEGLMASLPTTYVVNFDTQFNGNQWTYKYNREANTLNANTVGKAEIALDQVFEFSATGLKPSTKHVFTFAGKDYTAFCKQQVGGLFTTPSGPIGIGSAPYGTGLTTTYNGKIKFRFHLSKALKTLNPTDLITWEQAKSMFVSAKIAKIASTDGSSYAQFSINTHLAEVIEPWGSVWPGNVTH